MDKRALAVLALGSAAAGFGYLYMRERRKAVCQNYDVFLNFNGNDTRKGFTDHLYVRLRAAKITAFKDDCDLVGEIGPGLSRAIENSRVAICIISKNYGGSESCLTELSQIMHRRAEQGLLVLPIFYDVDVSDVRNQTGEFGKAFRKLAKDHTREEMKEWKKGLRCLTRIRGWISEEFADGHEGLLVKAVVEKVSSTLSPPWIERIPMAGEIRRKSNCQVFLISSPATTRTFTSHLPSILEYENIHVFREDDPYLIGKDFDHEIRNAMDHCKIFIPVISEDFLSSHDCLNKLAQIVKCSKENQQKILPVFYGLDPSQKRNVWNRIWNHMLHHNVPRATRRRWEKSFNQACSNAGLVSANISNGNGGALVRNVLKRVIRLLRSK